MSSVINLNDIAPLTSSRRKCASVIQLMDAMVAKMIASGMGRVNLEPDGILHRFDVAGEAQGKLSGWYIIYPDGIPCAVFGSWKTGIIEKITGIDDDMVQNATVTSVSDEDLILLQERIEANRREREAERQAYGQKASEVSRRMYNEAKPAELTHPYLVAKGIAPRNDTRQTASGELLVPLYREGSIEICGVQKIYQNGTKRFLKGFIKEAAFGWINGQSDTILICEGYATACSLNDATGQMVFFALDCGNLSHVAPIVRRAYQHAKIVICTDDDRWTKDQRGNAINPGLDAARKIASTIDARVVSPRFKSLDGQPTDFNDLAVRQGLADVRAQVFSQASVPMITSWGMELFENAAPEQRWLVDGLLPLSVPTVLAAAGGVGKGMLALDLGLRVAGTDSSINLNPGEDTWLGGKISSHGSVVILTAEDSKDDIHRRLQSLDPDGSRRRDAQGRLFVVPLPNAGGPIALVRAKQGFDQGYEATETFEAILDQLQAIPDLKLINIDPLASFVAVDINSNPQAAQFTQGLFARLATSTGATVLTAHHVGKAPAKSSDPIEAARAAVRGSTAIVDGVRGVIGIWACQDDKVVEKVKNLTYYNTVRKNDVFHAALVKANYKADTVVRTLVRSESGLLKAVDFSDNAITLTKAEAMNALVEVIREHAIQGSPYTKTGRAGVYERRSELPQDLKSFSKKRLQSMVEELLAKGRIVTCTYSKSVGRFIDVPDGPFATGSGEIQSGSTASSILENVDFTPF